MRLIRLLMARARIRIALWITRISMWLALFAERLMKP
jgi:hypothetical protein